MNRKICGICFFLWCFSISVLLNPQQASADNTKRGNPNGEVISVTQPDGQEIILKGKGTKSFTWYEDEDGYVVKQDPADKVWKYAEPDKSGEGLKPISGAIVGQVSPTSLGLKKQDLPGKQKGKAFGQSSSGGGGIPPGGGALPLTPEKEKYVEENFVQRDYCPPTMLGLKRMNEARAKKGLPAMTMDEARKKAKERGRLRKIKRAKEREKIEKKSGNAGGE